MSTCKYCGAEIIWRKMRSGKVMPCNTGDIPYKESENGYMKLVTNDGRVITAYPLLDMDMADGIGHVSHYATCPGVDRVRRR